FRSAGPRRGGHRAGSRRKGRPVPQRLLQIQRRHPSAGPAGPGAHRHHFHGPGAQNRRPFQGAGPDGADGRQRADDQPDDPAAGPGERGDHRGHVQDGRPHRRRDPFPERPGRGEPGVDHRPRMTGTVRTRHAKPPTDDSSIGRQRRKGNVKPVKIGLLGLGTVGSGVVRIVEEHQEDLQRQIGCPLSIEKILVKNVDKPRSVAVDPAKLTTDPHEVLNDPEIDLVVEVIGGTGAARDMVMAALERGKHVVTANKDLMALHRQDVLRKAEEKGCDVFYEASVAGGVPILRTLVDGFSSDRIYKIMGIVNGTTNYILSKMSQDGAAYEDVLREAQELGYAEADPTNDVEGYDAAYKMAILATLRFHARIDLPIARGKGILCVDAATHRCA